jgi:hypothetical protein
VISPPPPSAPTIIFVPAPVPVFIPAPIVIPAPVIVPAPVFIPAPVVEEKKEVVKVVETVIVKVVIPPVTIIEIPTVPADLSTQKREIKDDEPVVEKILTKIAVPKLPMFKGIGPFKFALGLSEQGSSAVIKDPDIAIGLKVISQTPSVCKVATTFSKATGKYSISVIGITNGQCRITAIDKGNEDKFPTATEIKQTITGIAVRKTVTAKAIKPTPTPKPGIKKASYKPPQG